MATKKTPVKKTAIKAKAASAPAAKAKKATTTVKKTKVEKKEESINDIIAVRRKVAVEEGVPEEVLPERELTPEEIRRLKAPVVPDSPETLNLEATIRAREMNRRMLEEYTGVRAAGEKKPSIPGVFDLLIPPGTPRKIIVSLAKEYQLEIVQRTDIYIPIGVSDVQRELLAFRGDEKTIKKMEKLLLKELKAYSK
jgi:hypothetical protein